MILDDTAHKKPVYFYAATPQRTRQKADVGDFYLRWQAVFDHHKAMVLAGDLNPSCGQIPYWVIGPAMPLIHLHCCPAKS